MLKGIPRMREKDPKLRRKADSGPSSFPEKTVFPAGIML